MSEKPDHPLPEKLQEKSLQTHVRMTQLYAALTTDFNPIHLDAGFAATTSFAKPIIHGTMGLNLLVEAIHSTFGGDLPNMEIDIRFVRPVHVGTTIIAGGTLKEATNRSYEVFVETDAGERAIEGICRLGSRMRDKSITAMKDAP